MLPNHSARRRAKFISVFLIRCRYDAAWKADCMPTDGDRIRWCPFSGKGEENQESRGATAAHAEPALWRWLHPGSFRPGSTGALRCKMPPHGVAPS